VGLVEEPIRTVMLRNTQLFNVTGHPAISLPAGRTPGGLPCALQVVGARMATESLASVALAIEMQLRSPRL
jgi:Asp-tRNA(Asn)/Glu-tRNA(Gln) amidotransferase A subunit family amidase